jgi:leucyl aminopeptidase (aminopeptidase T)
MTATPEPLAADLQTVLVFAARYAHSRNTGGTWVVVRTLKQHWGQLSDYIQEQILSESHEATTNLDDWQRLRDFVENYQTPP